MKEQNKPQDLEGGVGGGGGGGGRRPIGCITQLSLIL